MSQPTCPQVVAHRQIQIRNINIPRVFLKLSKQLLTIARTFPTDFGLVSALRGDCGLACGTTKNHNPSKLSYCPLI
ncbi:uncharacterized protein LAJ45_00200 [Morchella importuna]|uniref:uncharacterized protein n=1 Tax=Morchella importuna TaxID=1174673 RepID=UPI001E8DFD32|nr:uncharacterized protein LAJ45_00200 [Morchella importuna]KAH8155191.1 hypothetical protein LAJ45_00200 [Morchella importuna]